jgi:hypothetical protein
VRRRIKSLLLPALMLIGAGCSSADPPPQRAEAPGYVACQTPRPQICTREYRPVCARVDTGKRCVTTPCDSSVDETRATGCTACSDPKVMGYRDGAGPKKHPVGPEGSAS